MASCLTNPLLQSGACFCGASASPFQIAKLSLLCNIIQAINPMATCTLSTLLEDSKCFCGVTDNPFERVELQLLCNIASAAGSIVGCGTEDPTESPESGCSIYYRTDNYDVWVWNGSAWFKLID